ncbi:MAG: hypothetical protein RLZZ227_2893 [Pseudomonadota bacterium]|jgi:C4-dicarboxylate-specific signal transduction histidine kinase
MQERTLIDDPGRAPAREPGAAVPAAPPSLSRLTHDLNQPLSAINNYAQAGIQLIDNGMGDLPRLKQLLEKIAAQCGRATALSQEIGKTGAASPPAAQKS